MFAAQREISRPVYGKIFGEPVVPEEVWTNEISSASTVVNNSEVVLWTLEDGGHTWPGGKITKSEEDYLGIGVGPINHDISSMELIWEFFEKHPMK